MPTKYETVAVPVATGIDVTTRERLVPAKSLLEATNSRLGGLGAAKRHGHVGIRVRGPKPLPADASLEPMTAIDGPPSNWLFGWGPLFETTRPDPGVLLGTSRHPDAGVLFGAATRDSETLVWNGHQLFSRAPGQPAEAPFAVAGSAVMPTAVCTPTAKSAGAQVQPDIAQTSTLRVVAWLGDHDAHYTLQDVATGATLVGETALGLVKPTQIRCLPVGDWLHILVSTDGYLQLRSVHSANPTTVVARNLGPCVWSYFDVTKVSEMEWSVARNRTATIDVTWHLANGDTSTTPSSSQSLTGFDNVYAVGIAVSPSTNDYALAYRGNKLAGNIFTVYARAYDRTTGAPSGTLVQLRTDIGLESRERPVAIAAKYVTDSAGHALFDVYWDEQGVLNHEDGPPSTDESAGAFMRRFSSDGVALGGADRPWTGITSQAFSVGDRTFVWGVQTRSKLQTTWLLLDESLSPVGKLNFGTAAPLSYTEDGKLLSLFSSVNWAGEASRVTSFHCARGYTVRLAVDTPSTSVNPPPVFTEPSVQLVTLEFLPRLRMAQAGRTTYFAGAQLWAYDGRELAEAGFHICPDTGQAYAGLQSTDHVAPPGLQDVGAIYYRVDLCHRNAQNEEVRSHSLYSASAVLFAGDYTTVQLSIPTCPTRRTGSYFLVYRNVNAGTQWYLINSRDPSSALYVANVPQTGYATFTDDCVNTPELSGDLTVREQHPANGGFGYLDRFTAPACEVIGGGPDRLWVSGGEIPPGQVYPSRLFAPGDTPAFNSALTIEVDRTAGPVTALGFLGDQTAIFRRNSIFLQGGFGPDNSSQGFWEPARLAYSDVGAVSQESIALTGEGLFFQAPSGICLLTPGGGLKIPGKPVDSIASSLDIAGAMVNTVEQEVRWYARSGPSIVYNYAYDAWSTWTLQVAGCVLNPRTGLAFLASWDGSVLEETVGVYLDDGRPYLHRVRFAWLRAKDLMDYQAVRRIGAVGTSSVAHQVRAQVYYDERPFEEETFTWNFPNDVT